MLARVVSKWALFGTTLPGPPTSSNRMRSLARPWCVGRMCAKAGDLLQHRLEAEEARRAGVAFVGLHDAGPLLAAHRPGAAVGEQVDEHVLGRDQEHVEAGRRARSPRAARGVRSCSGSTTLIRNGSMMVFMAMHLRLAFGQVPCER